MSLQWHKKEQKRVSGPETFSSTGMYETCVTKIRKFEFQLCSECS